MLVEVGDEEDPLKIVCQVVRVRPLLSVVVVFVRRRGPSEKRKAVAPTVPTNRSSQL